MPSKVAATTTGVDASKIDIDFLIACLKNIASLPKPDFDGVARMTGAKSASACYQKHWSMMKKLGLSVSGGSGSASGGRGRPAKVAKLGRLISNAKVTKPQTKSKKAAGKRSSSESELEDLKHEIKTKGDECSESFSNAGQPVEDKIIEAAS